MAGLDKLESQLDDVFVKNAPFQLPKDVKDWIVAYMPYINLVLGILSLWGAYQLYRWATVANRILDYANEFSRAFGVESYAQASRLTVTVWLAVIVMAVQGALWVAAFSPAKAKKKMGWNLMFWALVANAAYGVVALFTDYSGVGSFIFYLLGTAVGMFFLFQIRSHYLGKVSTPTHASTEKTAKK